jgi:hypothetical protein
MFVGSWARWDQPVKLVSKYEELVVRSGKV